MCAFVLSLGASLGGACGKAGAGFAVQTPGSQRFSMGSSSIFSGSRVKAQKCAKKILGHKRGGARRGLVFPLGALVLTSEQISLGGFYGYFCANPGACTRGRKPGAVEYEIKRQGAYGLSDARRLHLRGLRAVRRAWAAILCRRKADYPAIAAPGARSISGSISGCQA